MADPSAFRLLHTMLRVKDQDKSIDFYTRHLGMKVLRQKEFEGGRFTNTFIGYGDETSETVLELTYNWDQDEPYSHGSGFGHLAVGVPDIYATCSALRSSGRRRTRYLRNLQRAGEGRRSHSPCARPDEAWHDGYRVHRGPGRIQD